MTITQDDGNSPIFNEARDELRWFCIGFVKLTVRDGVEDGQCGGSGTLVEVNGRKCILTAAHVVEGLRAHKGNIGIVRFLSNPKRLQNLKLNVEHVRIESVGEAPFGPRGPDIALLILPQDTAAALAATNSFYNLAERIEAEVPKGPHFECIAGVVHERTRDVAEPTFKNGKSKMFEASFEPGTTQGLEPNGEHDLISFKPQVDAGYTPPESYEGVSGAALWRVYCNVDEQKEPIAIPQLWLHGVAFYQSPKSQGARTITCHGPNSVFRLVAKSRLSPCAPITNKQAARPPRPTRYSN